VIPRQPRITHGGKPTRAARTAGRQVTKGVVQATVTLPRRLLAKRDVVTATGLFAALIAASLWPLLWPYSPGKQFPPVIASAAAVLAAAFVLRASGSMAHRYRSAWRLIGAALLVAAVWLATSEFDQSRNSAVGGALSSLAFVAGGLGLLGLLGLSARHGSKTRFATLALEATITGLSGLVVTWLIFTPESSAAGSRPAYASVVLAMVTAVLIAWFSCGSPMCRALGLGLWRCSWGPA